jgi:hypothetical protein
LGLEKTGRSNQEINFAGETFTANEDIDAKYTFNSWRLGYRYQFYDEGPWELWVGATAKVRASPREENPVST